MNQAEQQSNRFIRIFKSILPSPFAIVILLTVVTMLLALFLTKPDSTGSGAYFMDIVAAWESGLWDDSTGGIYFAFQMMFILVLGHILVLTPTVSRLMELIVKNCTNTANSVAIVVIGAMSMGLINWGLGLIFGSILARKVGEKFAEENKPLNYGLIGAAGYAAMMTWHGGISGAATTKSIEKGYIQEMMALSGIQGSYPETVPFETTIGHYGNIITLISCILLVATFLYFIGKRTKVEYVPQFEKAHSAPKTTTVKKLRGAEKLDFNNYFGLGMGIACLAFGVYQAVTHTGESAMGFIQLNYINFIFLGLALTLHKNLKNFSKALEEAIGDVSGILIQFPFYFGILGIMKETGLIQLFSEYIVSFATPETLPSFTYISAGVVNMFIPSGGGQWPVQGPIVIETAMQLGADLPKAILAFSYGDGLTNMIQPFWSLPLLGITQLKPQQVLPYSFIIFLIGGIVMWLGLLIF